MIEFRVFTKSDIPMFLSWLNEPHVKEFWNDLEKYGKEAVIEKYVRRIENKIIDMYIIVVNNNDIGYIQCYNVEYDNLNNYNLEYNCRGIDLFIGKESLINKGLGTKILKAFINAYIYISKGNQYVCIDPSVKNSRAIRSYEKVGFKHVLTKIDRSSNLLTYYMLFNRKQFLEINK